MCTVMGLLDYWADNPPADQLLRRLDFVVTALAEFVGAIRKVEARPKGPPTREELEAFVAAAGGAR